jgi:hypothetical protein
MSSNSNPLLPRWEDMIPLADQVLGQEATARLPESSLRLLLTNFTFKKLSPYSLTTLLFDPRQRSLVFELGFVTEDDIIHPASEEDNLFYYVTSPESLQWLLSIMTKDDALRLLHQPVGLVRKKPLLRILTSPPLLEILSEKLAGLPIFAFPDPEEFLQAFNGAISSLDTLKGIVDSTGIQNISPETRGNLLWYLCTNAYKAPHVFEFWVEVLESPLLVDQPALYEPTIFEALRNETRSLTQATKICKIFRRYETELVTQASQLANDIDLSDVLLALAKWILPKPKAIRLGRNPWSEAEGTDEDLFSEADLEFVIMNLFTPMARVCSERRESPSYALVKLLYAEMERFSNETELTERLFTICAAFDFSTEDDDTDVPEHHSLLTQYIAQHVDSLDGAFFRATRNWLFKISPAAMNEIHPSSSFNLLDMIIREAECMPDDLEELIHSLVQRGCRLSNPDRFGDYCINWADKQALELYFDAVSICSKK